MADQKPSPVTFHEYDIPSLNSWFAWSSVLLLLASLWMIWDDYEREWKGYQRRFNDVDIQRTQAAIVASTAEVDASALAAVDAKLAAAEEEVAARSEEQAELSSTIQGLVRGDWYTADQAYKFAKADLDVAKYEFDAALQHDHAVEEKTEELNAVLTRVEKARLAFEAVDAEKVAAESKLKALRLSLTEANKERDKLFRERDLLQTKLKKIEHSFVKDYFRDRPLVDFMAPSIKVQQAILPNLHEDVNFMTVPRVDRCHTCHQAIDKPGWTEETLEPVFRSHSNFDLIIGNHPVESFGCTGCHDGGGRALTFSDASHTPRDKAQKQQWKDDYDWHPLHHWDFPQLPLQYTQAYCTNCHVEESRIPGADKLNAGRELVEEYGCAGCHKINRPGYTDLRKVGPDLSHIGDKVTKKWLLNWIREPKAFRPTTKMPRIWFNGNTDEATATMNYPLRNEVEIEGVGRYLLAQSKPYASIPKPTGKGDPANGKWVVDNRGCKACHVVGADDTGEGRYGTEFGPSLHEVGSKTTIDWMYAWILDPKSLWADTKMPDLRLTKQEALDAATYLKSLTNPAFEKIENPDVSTPEAQKMLADVAYEYLRKETTTADAEVRLAAMDEEARFQYVGKKLIGRQGCFGCHSGIGGYENAQPIGVELTEWASKLLTKFDFGLQHGGDIEHNKHSWLKNKLLRPRIWDEGKVESKHPQDLLRMPNFQFTEEQADLIMTAVLGFRKDLNEPAAQYTLDFKQAAIEDGRRQMRENNCQGCHVIENVGGGMETVIAGGEPFAPPVLEASYEMPDGRTANTHQGAKVKPDWFFGFLKAPTTIRPWLNLRMPSFALEDDEATHLIKYFSNLAEGEPFPYTSFDRASLDPELVRKGSTLFKELQCINCHLPLEQAKKLGVKEEELAPNLELTKSRLKYTWLRLWLTEPAFVQEGTRMPSYFKYWDEDEHAYVDLRPDSEIDALRAYLQYHGESLPVTKLAAR